MLDLYGIIPGAFIIAALLFASWWSRPSADTRSVEQFRAFIASVRKNVEA